MSKSVSSYTNGAELSTLMANAKRLGNEAVYSEAFKRRCEIEGFDYEDPLHRDFHVMLTAYELTLEEKHGYRQPAIRTRQKLKNKGVEQCLIDWALSSQETQGFQALIERDMVQFTAEYVVVQHSDRFEPKVVAAAKKRLDSHR